MHFMGIGGSGMAGVAMIASKMGYKVTGCDLESATAYSKDIFKGHDKSHLKDIDLLVVSPAVFYQNSKNPELIEGKRRGIAVTWQEFLGRTLLKNKKVIAIAGTHGKSTTTAMTAKILIDNGMDPIVVVGARVPEWNGNSRFGGGQYAVVEADEFNDNFLNYSPEIAVINNIEFDHPDYFKNESQVKKSFGKFRKRLVGAKILITQEDSLGKKFNLKVWGEHNQKNANMAFLIGKKLGISDEKIISSIEKFKGIGRRMELIAKRRGVEIYDDYAHHPTAIKTTLEGVRKKYSKAKILVIVEPHGYRRTKALLAGYKGVFDSADKVFIGPIFQARDKIDSSITPQKVAEVSDHKDISAFDSFEELFVNCKLKIVNYDVVVIMGAGKSYLWARKITELLPVRFSDLTSFRIGGRIKKYFEVKNLDEIAAAVKYAKISGKKLFILGDGTDILVSDKDFDGIVIKYAGTGVEFDGEFVTAEAGVNWDSLVDMAVGRGLGGIESLSGIPGTSGAAPIQNIGAYGHELKEVFVSLEAYDIERERVTTFDRDECKFGYRESIFKQKDHWQKYLIIKIKLKLSKNPKPQVGYESLKTYVSKSPSIQEIRQAVLKVRSEKLEDPAVIGNAGSFFKNPIIDGKTKEILMSKYPGISIFPFGKMFKVSAGWLIENAGWKGKKFKNAGVSAKHALIIVNPEGKASAKDVYDLSEKIIDDVYKQFRVKLEREVQLINF